jgi:hypothetical protein
MKLDQLQSALMALSKRSRASVDMLNAHLHAAEDLAEAAQKQHQFIGSRLDRMLAPPARRSGIKSVNGGSTTLIGIETG